MTQYSGVYTLQQQAQALTSGQWATDPYYKNTTLLLHADGVGSGAQNNMFLDSSSNAFAITRNGNTTQGSFTPYGPDWSVNFGSTSGDVGLYMNGQAAFAFGTGDFTIEMWVNLQSVATYQDLIDFRPTSTQGFYPTIYIDTPTSTLRFFTNSADQIVGTTTFTYNTWHHVALSRSGTSTRLFLDGVQQGSTYTDSNNYIVGASRPYTAFGYNNTGYMMYGGYLSNLRIMKGQALYTSAFTPSTVPLTTTSQGAIAANVSLLTAQSNRFVDNSSNGFTVNVAGTVSVQRFSPFPPQYQYTTSVIGGSGYFDGSGDSLTLADNAAWNMGSGNFTAEAWIYPTSFANEPMIMGQWSGDVGGTTLNWALMFDASSAGYLRLITSSNGSGVLFDLSTSTFALTLNMWQHIAAVRNGNTFTIYVNGVSRATTTNASALYDATNNFTIGAESNTPTQYFLGYICDARVVKGSAVYTTAFTPPTAPLTAVANTQLLLNMTNTGIYDNAMMNDLETVGNAQVSTSVVKYGSGSLAFDGSGDYLQTPVTPNLAFFTGDYTVEMWVYPTSYSAATNYPLWDQRGNSATTTTGAYFGLTQTNGYPFVYVYSSYVVTGSVAAKLNTWSHVAYVRANGVLTVYLNGVNIGSAAHTSSLSDPSVYVTRFGQSAVGGTENYTGYMDDVRITKGVARYTSNFIPPKVAFANQ